MSNGIVERTACPACGAEQGETCTTVVDGVDMGWTHDARANADARREADDSTFAALADKIQGALGECLCHNSYTCTSCRVRTALGLLDIARNGRGIPPPPPPPPPGRNPATGVVKVPDPRPERRSR